MKILTSEPMTYKSQKRENEILTKLRIIKYSVNDKVSHMQISQSFGCHRNTIDTIVKNFNKYISPSLQKILLQSTDINKITEIINPILDKSTKPKRHPKQASKEQEIKIIDIFNNYLSVGPKRMRRHINHAYNKPGNNHNKVTALEKSLTKISLAQFKGVYKRNNLRIKKKRTVNGESKHIYDYKQIAAFEYMHIDTKHILDQGALPPEIYKKFLLNDELPIYEWNIMDAKSRFRFIAYSHNLSSEFGFKLLVSTIQYIRGLFNNHDLHINILTDGGVEFYRGSIRKEAEWNKILNLANAHIESYELGNDIRKNLIERSHKSDDEELFVPRGPFIHDKQSFLKEARDYLYYWNSQRPHSGIEMYDRTPLEVLQDSGLVAPHRLLSYPTMILEDDIHILSDITNTLELKSHLKDKLNPNEEISQKILANLKLRFSTLQYFLPINAQNVLTPYLFEKKYYKLTIVNCQFILLSPNQ